MTTSSVQAEVETMIDDVDLEQFEPEEIEEEVIGSNR